MSRRGNRLAFAFFLGALGLAALTYPKVLPPTFLTANVNLENQTPVAKRALARQTPWVRREFLPVAAPSVHAPSLAELSDGRLAAAWFAGSREGAGDVRIVFSIRDQAWETPRTIANREQTERDTRRNVRKLGNPVLFADNGKLHLFYVSAGMGGWAGSSINYRQSTDDGEHWTTATKLVTSPFFNVSTLVRMPPLKLADGSFGLPVYHELVTKHGEWLRITPNGQLLNKSRMPLPRPSLQPAVIALDEQRAMALLRDSGPGKGHIQVSLTQDGGQHWQTAAPLPLTNPNSSLALLRLQDGRLLLAANPGSGRDVLELWLADAAGQTWKFKQTVDSPQLSPPPRIAAGTKVSNLVLSDEVSYPALLQTQDGLIHLAYTWHRQRIRLLSFNAAWLDNPTKTSIKKSSASPKMPTNEWPKP